MARKGENIYKRKDGRWEGRYIKSRNQNGCIHYGYIYGKTYTEVKKKIKDNNFASNAAITNQSKELLFELVINEWLSSQQHLTKESSFARYYQISKTHLIPSLGKVNINDITSSLIINYLDSLLQAGRIDGNGGLSTKTVKDIYSIIRSILQYANQNNYTTFSTLNSYRFKQNYTKINVLSTKDQEKLTQILLNEMDNTKYGVLLSLYTGIRLGELCALKWKDINLSSGILSITQTMQRIKDISKDAKSKTKIIITEPKSECSKRDIPLPNLLVELSKELCGEAESYVLTGKKERFVEPRTMQNRFKALITQSNVDCVNFHVLRHTFATRCIELGFEIKTLSEILGHSSVNITLNRYVHSSLEAKKANMNKIVITSYSPS